LSQGGFVSGIGARSLCPADRTQQQTTAGANDPCFLNEIHVSITPKGKNTTAHFNTHVHVLAGSFMPPSGSGINNSARMSLKLEVPHKLMVRISSSFKMANARWAPA